MQRTRLVGRGRWRASRAGTFLLVLCFWSVACPSPPVGPPTAGEPFGDAEGADGSVEAVADDPSPADAAPADEAAESPSGDRAAADGTAPEPATAQVAAEDAPAAPPRLLGWIRAEPTDVCALERMIPLEPSLCDERLSCSTDRHAVRVQPRSGGFRRASVVLPCERDYTGECQSTLEEVWFEVTVGHDSVRATLVARSGPPIVVMRNDETVERFGRFYLGPANAEGHFFVAYLREAPAWAVPVAAEDELQAVADGVAAFLRAGPSLEVLVERYGELRRGSGGRHTAATPLLEIDALVRDEALDVLHFEFSRPVPGGPVFTALGLDEPHVEVLDLHRRIWRVVDEDGREAFQAGGYEVSLKPDREGLEPVEDDSDRAPTRYVGDPIRLVSVSLAAGSLSR
ncbi:MAG: hypothetical protein JXB32_02925 [Deltaproteobacteria bacterium]|nr:hypothetical protein [Deltaproteobacteria bacterium]